MDEIAIKNLMAKYGWALNCRTPYSDDYATALFVTRALAEAAAKAFSVEDDDYELTVRRSEPGDFQDDSDA